MHRKTILIVDDDLPSREILKMAIESWGYTIYLAEDGNQALPIFREKQPAIVITDLVMPNLNGLALLRQLKQERPGIAVVFLTAYANVTNAVTIMKQGATDLLTKPVNFQRLKLVLDTLCTRDAMIA
jgi:two-component system response regulator HydG